MIFEFQPLSQSNALVIANEWKYKECRSCGFRDVKVIEQSSNGGVYEFLVMEKAR